MKFNRYSQRFRLAFAGAPCALVFCLALLPTSMWVSPAFSAESEITVQQKTNPKDGATMVFVPAGEFKMGSEVGPNNEKPVHTVYLDGFWIYKNEVTVAQFKNYCQATGAKLPTPPKWELSDNHPIVNVTWDDAKAYCKWAGGHLPTEAQWEKAARGMDQRKYPWGNEFSQDKLWSSKAEDGDAKSTAPVGSFPEGDSPYGCSDMAGNAGEWCADFYFNGYYALSALRNPICATTSSQRVARGGSWRMISPDQVRSSIRNHFPPEYTDHDKGTIGFRCSQDP